MGYYTAHFINSRKAVMNLRIEHFIKREWEKPCNNASDAHWRAREIERLEQIKSKL